MTEYSDLERQTLRTAARRGPVPVSSAQLAMMDMVNESFAASKAFAASSPEQRDEASSSHPRRPLRAWN